MANEKSKSRTQCEALAEEIKSDFGWGCACCSIKHATAGKESALTIFAMDGNEYNHSRENLIALYAACREKMALEAHQYFNTRTNQPSLLKGYDYLSRIHVLWREGLQNHQKEQLRKTLRDAMLGLHRKKYKQMRLFGRKK